MVSTLLPVEVGDLPRPPSRAVQLRLLGYVAGVGLLAAAVVAATGRFGFNPTDQGFVLSLSWRILNGAIPHVDLMSPRPLGSGVLHIIDFALPAPLFLASGFVTMVQIIVSTIACAALLTGTSPLRWGPLRIGLVAAASLVNLHTFTLMAWHTIDGIFLTSVGWWLVDVGLRSQSAWRRRIGLFLLGFAVMTKQSFMFAAPVGVLLLLVHPSANFRDWRWWRRSVVDMLCLSAFPLIYVTVVTAAGGLSTMIRQLTGGTGTWGENLYMFWFADLAPGDTRWHIAAVAGCVVLAAVTWLARGALGKAAVWVRLVPIVGAAAITLYGLIQPQLAYPATWATRLLWLFLLAIVLDALVHKHFPWRAGLIAVLAYMTSLSWGYAVPGLLAGTIVLSTLELLARAVPEIQVDRRWLVPQAILAVIALGWAGLTLITAHDKAPANDQPTPNLTVDLAVATPQLSGIRTTPQAAAYVSQLGECTRLYPADKVAVFSDNAFAYPAFKLHNPFPMDWPVPLELVDNTYQRMEDTVARLNRDGDYLVLFQTVPSSALVQGSQVAAAVAPEAPMHSASALEGLVRTGLTGQKVSCGGFVGVWSPHE